MNIWSYRLRSSAEDIGGAPQIERSGIVGKSGSLRAALTSLVLLILCAAVVHAAVKPNALISDGAVLQQGMPVPVWGSAADGEKVTVAFQDQTASAVAQDGKWMVRLKPLTPGGPFTMTIAGENTLEFNDILVGEVWIASGQSNMAWPIDRSADADRVKAASTDPMLHLFTVPHADLPAPATDVEGRWSEAGPDTIGGFSAVAYFFGRDLRKALNVPVGIINSSVGGTAAQQWTRRSFLESDPELAGAITSNTGGLYNGMIAPLIPYAFRGAIWYQGESNAGAAYQYRTLFPGMIRNWREDWGEGDFPFLFVQLAPFQAIDFLPKESAWAELREAQLLTSLRVRRTGMAVITDVGDEADIHPIWKEPVGGRLALLALRIAYGKPVVDNGPLYKSMQVKGRYVTLSFDHVDGGLVAKGGDLTGFAVAGEDRAFVNARAKIQGDKVLVWSARVDHPVAVRFGWANCPVVNLFNQAGVPASPFRTDDFPMVTGPK
jgi:sialate O-acetylesterase